MKKAAVPTTAANGTAVRRSRSTAVQSVYIAADENRHHHLRLGRFGIAAATATVLVTAGLALLPMTVVADVEFEDCQPSADGGVTCDTRPTGNTRLDAFDARFGLFDEASPGWNEFEPFGGYGDMFGGNGT